MLEIAILALVVEAVHGTLQGCWPAILGTSCLPRQMTRCIGVPEANSTKLLVRYCKERTRAYRAKKSPASIRKRGFFPLKLVQKSLYLIQRLLLVCSMLNEIRVIMPDEYDDPLFGWCH